MPPDAKLVLPQQGFYRRLVLLALPITLQTLLFSGKGMLDTLMLASLNETSVAAAGAASKFLFVATMFLLGLAGGSAQLMAQAYGAWRKQPAVASPLPELLGRSVQLLFCCASLLTLLFWLTADVLMLRLCRDAQTAHEASVFLRIMSLSFPLFAYTSSVYAALRTLGQAGMASWFCGLGVVVNVLLNCLLIYGYAGLPALGSRGAALGTLASAVCESLALLLYLRWRAHALANFPLLKRASLRLYRQQLTLSLQIAANASLWALGSFCFFAILAAQSATSLVMLALLAPLESLAMAFLIGLATAASIVIGQTLGANDSALAQSQARQALQLAWFCGVITAVLCYLAKPLVLLAYPELSDATRHLFAQVYDLMALSFILKACALMLLAGILRAGGDNGFCLKLDFTAQWLLLLPLTWVLAAYADWGALALFALGLLEEGLKVALAYWRLQQGRWQHRLWQAAH